MYYCINIILKSEPTAEAWDRMSGLLFTLGSCGLDEGEQGGPEGVASLTAGHHPEDENEFLQAIAPGLLHPPQTFKAYFDNQDTALHAVELLKSAFPEYEPASHSEHVPDQDYSASWKLSFVPLFAAPQWLIHAPWHEPNQVDATIPTHISERTTLHRLIIEPGMAFGTGTHETTRSCLTLLSKHFSTSAHSAAPVLDFGCGSGILAIGAKKLGAKSVHAIDIDPLALDATKANAARNSVDVNVSFTIPLTQPHEYSVILANVLKGTLLEFKPQFLQWLKPGGLLVLSGLLNEQAKDITVAYCDQGFVLLESLTLGEWTSLALRAP